MSVSRNDSPPRPRARPPPRPPRRRLRGARPPRRRLRGARPPRRRLRGARPPRRPPAAAPRRHRLVVLFSPPLSGVIAGLGVRKVLRGRKGAGSGAFSTGGPFIDIGDRLLGCLLAQESQQSRDGGQPSRRAGSGAPRVRRAGRVHTAGGGVPGAGKFFKLGKWPRHVLRLRLPKHRQRRRSGGRSGGRSGPSRRRCARCAPWW